MTGLLKKLVPSQIGSQIAVLIVMSLLVAIGVTTTVFMLQSQNLINSRGALPKLAFAAKLLDAMTTPEARAAVLRIARQGLPDLSELAAVSPESVVVADDLEARDLQADLGARFQVFAIRSPEDGERRIAVHLPDGNVLAVQVPRPPEPQLMLMGIVTFLAVVLTLVFVWGARALTAPLARFAAAAEQFTADRSDVPLNERGPIEIRRLARALNDMRERIRSLIEDRTRMLAAVGHDLRTPITRLRLRAEDIEREPLRRQVIRDLDTMQDMVQSALSFLREEAVGASQHVQADLPSVVQALCDDFADMGRDFQFIGPPHLYVDCDPDQLTRAIANLVDNGLKFGTAVSVRIDERADEVFIDVADDGPGIGETDKAKVIAPFYRGDSARNLSEHGSFGLGLSIARSIIEAHHGRLELLDAAPQGLLARLVLPKGACRLSDGARVKKVEGLRVRPSLRPGARLAG